MAFGPFGFVVERSEREREREKVAWRHGMLCYDHILETGP